MRSYAAKLTTAASITIVLALSGTGIAVAQPGSQFQTQGIRQSEGLRRIPYNTHRTTRRAVRRGAVVTGAAVGTGAYYGTGTGYYGGTGPYYGTGYYGTNPYGTGYYGSGYYGSGYYGTNPYGTGYYGAGYYRLGGGLFGGCGLFGRRCY